MLILNLAVPSSGSTLISNVIGRLLTDARRKMLISYYADRLSDVIYPQAGPEIDVVVKSHEPRNDLRLLASTRTVKGIVSVRDPRDCIVSLMQRFGRPFNDAYSDVAASFAHIAAIPMANMLLLRYEEWHPLKPDTVKKIAGWLDVSCSKGLARDIAAQLEFSTIKAYVETISSLPEKRLERGVDSVSDSSTGFSTRHLTDGVIGKYRTALKPRERQLADSLLGIYLEKYRYGKNDRHIKPACFAVTQHGERADDGILIKPLDGNKHCCVYGPYMRLPAGVWRVRYLLSGARGQVFDVDVVAGPNIVGQGTYISGDRPLEIKFKIDDSTLPVEFRVYARSNTGEVLGRFEGVTLDAAGV